MKVYDLCCDNAHRFEGWFANEADLIHQQQTAVLCCPLCHSNQVSRQLSAPRLNLRGESANDESASAPCPAMASSTALTSDAQLNTNPNAKPNLTSRTNAENPHWLSLLRSEFAKSEDVGEAFAEQARQMHHGEIEAKAIRGKASPEEALELLSEGVAILPMPAILKETLQ